MAGAPEEVADHLVPTPFEVRRAELVGQIGDSLEQVLTQINAVNRSLEGIIEVSRPVQILRRYA